MHKEQRRFIVLICLAIISCLTSTTSLAWKKSDHQRMAGILKGRMSCLKNSSFNATDAGWADTNAARDKKGTLFISEERTSWTAGIGDLGHARFDDWPSGHAHQNSKGFFSKATSKSKGFVLARGSHFIMDVGQPFHTFGQVFCQANHIKYEKWVADNWTSKGFKRAFVRGMNAQLSSNNPSKGLSKSMLVERLARVSRGYMKKLCSGGPKWKTNPEATRALLYQVGRYTAAYTSGGVVCR